MTANSVRLTLETAIQHHQAGNHAEAEKLYTKILDQDPAQVDALNLLGVIAQQTGDLDRALELFDRAMAAAPALATVPFNKANALREAGQTTEAHAAYEAALVIDPKYTDALLNLGALQQESGETARAIATFNRLLEIAPDTAQAHYNIGKCRHVQGRLDDAQSALAKAISLDPAFADAHFAMASLLADQDKPEIAIDHIKTAIKLKPKWASAYANWGNFLCALDQHEDALKKYEQSLALDDTNANTRANYGLALLTLGQLEKGWEFYKSRTVSDAPYYSLPETHLPHWQGDDLSGARVLVFGEQGLGEQILFASMLEEFANKVRTVTVACSKKILPVFETSFRHLANVRFQDEGSTIIAAEHDVQTTFVDIGHCLRSAPSDFPPAKPYLAADVERADSIRHSLEKEFGSGGFFSGLCWASANREIGRHKSIPVQDWKPVMACENANFVSLQAGAAAEDMSQFENLGLPVPYTNPNIDLLDDLSGVVSYIWSLDHVITCSNTVAHLSGALGKPTWVLLPTGRARLWYWFRSLDRSPWYPEMSFYRQQMPGDWTSVMAQVSKDFRALLKGP